MTKFRYRGIKVVVDTTDTAEFDIADNKLSDKFLDKIVKNFTDIPYSNEDVCNGDLRARTIDGFDFMFIVGRLENNMVVTIGGVSRHTSKSALEDSLKIAERIGILRSATGI